MAKPEIDSRAGRLIPKICEALEKRNKIEILFAVENGSRAWRMNSANSDYDVRFVFSRNAEDYIAINQKPDTIGAAFDWKGKSVPTLGSYIDLSGFDIIKFARMLSSSNPTAIEWLTSDILYYGKQNPVFKKFARKNFSPISLYFHYKSMCRQNYLKYLKTGAEVTYKKYLYAMRGLANAKWVAIHRTIPPIDFRKTIEKSGLPMRMAEKLKEIIALKAKGKEKDIVQNIPEIDSYIENFLKDDSEAPKKKTYATFEHLDKELKKIVMKK